MTGNNGKNSTANGTKEVKANVVFTNSVDGKKVKLLPIHSVYLNERGLTAGIAEHDGETKLFLSSFSTKTPNELREVNILTIDETLATILVLQQAFFKAFTGMECSNQINKESILKDLHEANK